jgi:hypothetical protein
MKKEIRKLIKKTVGGGEDKDWFIELEEGVEEMIKNIRKQERERIIEILETWFKEGTEDIEDIIKSLK